MSVQTGLSPAARILRDREVAITHDVDHRTRDRAGVRKQEPIHAEIVIGGLGHAVGSVVVSNVDLARSLALPDDWFVRRTGIVERRVCGEGETVLTLAAQAVRQACAGADVDVSDLGEETIIIHIQNGLTQLTPPSGIALVEQLGMDECRVLAIDGVCAEPIPAVEIATLMLDAGRCDRVILSAAADFLPIVRHDDTATAGLFGSGAGARVPSRPEVANANGSSIIHASSWKTYAAHAGLGRVRVLGHTTNENGFAIQAGYYEMDVPARASRARSAAGSRRRRLEPSRVDETERLARDRPPTERQIAVDRRTGPRSGLLDCAGTRDAPRQHGTGQPPRQPRTRRKRRSSDQGNQGAARGIRARVLFRRNRT